MTIEELQRRVDESPPLAVLRDQLTDELAAQSTPEQQFDPFLAIMVISIIVQVIIHCRENSAAALVQQNIRELRTIPPRKIMYLRRRLNNLWREHCDKTGIPHTRNNPLLGAVYAISDTVDDVAAKNLMALAVAS